MQYFTDSSTARSVSRRSLGLLLKGFRSERNESLDEVETRGYSLLNAPESRDRYGAGWSVQTFQTRGAKGLEDSSKGLIELLYTDCRFICSMYDLDAPVLFAVLSTPSSQPLHAWDDFVSIREDKPYDRGIRFEIPDLSLDGADGTSIAVLNLDDAGGASETHWHTGDEIVYVQEGSVDLSLRSSGLRVHLRTGELIHFHAEQLHCVINASSEAARVMVIRISRSDRRSQLLKQLKRKNIRADDLTESAKRVISEFRYAIRFSTSPGGRFSLGTDSTCIDRTGLGNYLDQIRSGDFRGNRGALTVEMLAKRAKELNLSRFNVARFQRIHHAQSDLTLADAVRVADVYDTRPFLLMDYFLPQITTAVALTDDDWFPAPPHIIQQPEAEYSLPVRRLADGDISISRLRLRSLGSTPINSHPGQEILIPVQGEFDLQVGENQPHRLVQGYAHFHSSEPHQIFNPGHDFAELLVVRILR